MSNSSTSFVSDLLYSAPTDQVAGLSHTFTTGRKTWKMSKGKSEVIWPSHIEAALFDGLEKYKPTSSRNPRLLRRFPKRNRFLADHIYKLTGQVRTPKQVGSRLQQLRDTCPETKVLNLLSRREFSPEVQASSTPRSSPDDLPSTFEILAPTPRAPALATAISSSFEDMAEYCSPTGQEIHPSYQNCEPVFPSNAEQVIEEPKYCYPHREYDDPFNVKQLEAPWPAVSCNPYVDASYPPYIPQPPCLPDIFNADFVNTWTMDLVLGINDYNSFPPAHTTIVDDKFSVMGFHYGF